MPVMNAWRVAVTCALLSAVGGCGSGSSAPSPVGATALSLRVADATVAVTGRGPDGVVRRSGTVVDGRRGLIVTTAHDFWGARGVTLDTTLGTLHARVAAASACDDLLLLATQPSLPGLGALEPPAGTPDGPPAGTEPDTTGATRRLDAVGFRWSAIDGLERKALQLHETRGHRSGEPVALGPGLPVLRRALQLDIAVADELGGGPVVDDRGRLAGVLAAGPDSRDIAVDVAAVRALRGRMLAADRRVGAGEAACRRALTARAGGRAPVLDEAPGVMGSGDGTDDGTAGAGTPATTGRTRPGLHIPLEGVPTDVTISDGVAWVTLAGTDDLVGLDARTGAPRPSLETLVGPDPLRVAAGPGAVWTVGAADRWLGGRRRTGQGRRAVRLKLTHPAVAVAAGAGVVWVTGGDAGTLTRVDPVSVRVLGTETVARHAGAIATAGDAVWVLDAAAGTVVRIDAVSGRRVGLAVPAGSDLTDLAVSDGTVWVADRAGAGSVTRLDAQGRRLGKPVPVGGLPVALAAARDRVLALVLDADGDGARVLELRPGAGAPRTLASLSGSPGAIACTGNDIWITDARAREAVRLDG
jgi:hypothetical protein